MIEISVVFLNILFIGYSIHLWIQRKWPEPYVREYVCDRCWRSYRDATTLSWHRTSQHVELVVEDDSFVRLK